MRNIFTFFIIFVFIFEQLSVFSYAQTDDYHDFSSVGPVLKAFEYRVYSDHTYSYRYNHDDEWIYAGDNSNYYLEFNNFKSEINSNQLDFIFSNLGIIPSSVGTVGQFIYSIVTDFFDSSSDYDGKEEDYSAILNNDFSNLKSESKELLKNALSSCVKDLYNNVTGKRVWNGGAEYLIKKNYLNLVANTVPEASYFNWFYYGDSSISCYVFPDDDSLYYGDLSTSGSYRSYTIYSATEQIKCIKLKGSDLSGIIQLVENGSVVAAKAQLAVALANAEITYLSKVEAYYNSSGYPHNSKSNNVYFYTGDITGYASFDLYLNRELHQDVYFTSDCITNLDEHVENFINNNTYNPNYDYSQHMQNTYNTINNNITQGSDLTYQDVQHIIDSAFSAGMEEMKEQLDYLNKTEEERSFELVKNFKELWKRFDNLDELLTLNNGFLSSIDDSMTELLGMDFGGDSVTNIENNIDNSTNIYNDISNYFDNGFTDGTGWEDVRDTFKNKFPFCIPWDITYLFYSFAAEPEAPSWIWSWEIPLPDSRVYEVNIDINLAEFEPLAKISRLFTSLIFIFFLISKTKSFINEEVL